MEYLTAKEINGEIFKIWDEINFEDLLKLKSGFEG